MNDREQGLPGSGLGLFIVRTVADRHGGAAVARRAPGGGAEFELSLPAA
jgi:signal transduction histidine kinase